MEQYATELLRRREKPKDFSPVVADGVDDIWGMDLADMPTWYDENDGNKYVLVVVDVLSRYAWCQPLKEKSAEAVWAALDRVMKDAKSKPSSIWVDKGKEFYNSLWTKKLKALDIQRYSTFNDFKVSIAERFIRTLKHRLWFHFVSANTRKWIDVLQREVEAYNHSEHGTIKMTPAEAQEPANEDKLLDMLPPVVKGKPRYKLGQWVRINRLKGLFEKGFHPTWSYEIFKIVGISLDKPVRYHLVDYFGEDVQGSFYDNDLQPVADPTFFPVEKVLETKKVKGKVMKLVKFLGYKQPRWVTPDQLADL
jgi:hypothetical protein